MSDVDRLRHRIRAAISPLALAALGAGCASEPRLPPCPGGDVCTTVERAQGMKQTPETQLMCPTYIVWNAERGDVSGLGIPPFGEGTLDHEVTRKRRGAGASDACCYHWHTPCPGGRPLVEGGRALLPDVRRGDALPLPASTAALPPRTRQALAAAWLEDARAEHASVASFARATIELLALGAPLELVAATQRASLDEVRHAEGCFALASRYAGRVLEPGPLAAALPREPDLARLARDTFEEGCVAETLASLCAQRALVGCEEDDVRAVLEEIADDEADHAALAWSTLAWALRAGGAPVRDVLRAAASGTETASSAIAAFAEEQDRDAARHGRLGPLAHADAMRAGWSGIVAPLLAEVLGA